MGKCQGGEACEECAQKCMLVHGRRNPSPIVTSFVKVMIGEQFDTTMFIPPKFSRTIASLENKDIYLENAIGERWRVKVSRVDGNLAFQQGWNEFATHHALEYGDVLIFYYILKSHFVVQIYGSTGCEKFKLFEKNDTRETERAKRSSDHLPSAARSWSASRVPTPIVDKNILNEEGSSSTIHSNFDIEMLDRSSVEKSVEKEKVVMETTSYCNGNKTKEPVQVIDLTEVPFDMFDRRVIDKQEASRCSLFDLSKFEKLESKASGDGKGNVSQAITKEFSHTVQLHAPLERTCMEEHRGIDHKTTVLKGRTTRGMVERTCNPKDGGDIPSGGHEIPRSINTSKEHPRVLPTSTVGCRETEPMNLILSDKQNSKVFDRTCRKYPAIEELKSVLEDKEPLKVEVKHVQKVKAKRGRPLLAVKVEPVEIDNNSFEDEGKSFKKVKTESVDSVSLPPIIPAYFSISVPAVTQSYLELPTDLPTCAHRGRLVADIKIMLLRDPSMRKWPVFYHEKSGFRVLASGWKALAKANNIREGDVCRLVLENESEALLQITIDRKQSL